MASSTHNAGDVPTSVDRQQQGINTSQQTQTRLTTALEQQVQQRLEDLARYLQQYESNEELSKELIAFVSDRQTDISLDNILVRLEDSLDSWKNLPLHIAVTGKTGSGKSAFINTVRGLVADDVGAAEVGTTEQNTEPHPYPHPDNPKLLFWDLPGVGTQKFPRDTYLKDIHFERFDCYIIITSERFTENDLWLAKQVESKGKKFYFIRNKVDQDIRNELYDHPKLFDEATLIEKLRQNCLDNLQNAGLKMSPVFIISSHLINKEKWEFSIAIQKLVTDLPVNKQEALLLSLSGTSILTEEMIDMKRKYLTKRIAKVSALAALGGICPLPCFNVLLDYTIISDAKNFYCKQFGLSDEVREVHENKIMKILTEKMSSVKITSTVTEYIALRLAANAGKDVFSQILIQGAKMATNSVTSYKLVSVTLEEILSEYADIAKQEIRRKIEDLGNN